MRISVSGRLDRPAYAVDASAKRLAWWVQVATMILGVILYVTVAVLSAVALHQSGAGVTWTQPG